MKERERERERERQKERDTERESIAASSYHGVARVAEVAGGALGCSWVVLGWS